jgi:hypothetical protein
MDPELGMGIQFTTLIPEHRRRLEGLIQRVTERPDTAADVMVEPEGLDWKGAAESYSDQGTQRPGEEVHDDPLVKLFCTAATLSRKEFVQALEQHKLALLDAAESVPNSTSAQRSEPRLNVSRPVQIWMQDGPEESARHATSMIDLSHHGTRIDGTAMPLRPGDPVHLVSEGQDLRFRVIWVGKPGSPEEGQVGLQITDD